jgi:hypothetical protein
MNGRRLARLASSLVLLACFAGAPALLTTGCGSSGSTAADDAGGADASLPDATPDSAKADDGAARDAGLAAVDATTDAGLTATDATVADASDGGSVADSGPEDGGPVADGGLDDAADADAATPVDASDGAAADAETADAETADAETADAGPDAADGCAGACTPGAVECTSNGIATCVTDAGACPAFGAPVACGAHATCGAGVDGGPACVCNSAPTCTDAGALCTSSTAIETCARDSNGCLYVSTAASPCTTFMPFADPICAKNACSFVCQGDAGVCGGLCCGPGQFCGATAECCAMCSSRTSFYAGRYTDCITTFMPGNATYCASWMGCSGPIPVAGYGTVTGTCGQP